MNISPTGLASESARQACQSTKEALLGQRYEDVRSIDRLAGTANNEEAKRFYTDLSSFLKGAM